ncbi:MAG: exopolysaccharide Pel transporter PelG [Myxococcales bacterium]
MAGIGFELRRLLAPRTYGAMARAYGYAGLIASGPWLSSVLGVTAVGVLGARTLATEPVTAFLVSVTWLMAASLVFTGPLQLLLSRFVADRVFEEKVGQILPNILGALCLTTAASGLCGALLAPLFEGAVLRILLVASFTVLCDLWVVVVLLSGLKAFRPILCVFLAGYALSAVATLPLRAHGTQGLLAAFLLGEAAMLFALLAMLLRSYPAERLTAFDFLDPKQAFYGLALTGFVYNLGIWADKLVFWLDPGTSAPALGPLRFSLVYDLPIFFAYLSVVPGAAIFLLRVETDFAEEHRGFYALVREGGTLQEIERGKEGMVRAARQGLADLCKAQGASAILAWLLAPRLLPLLHVSSLYVPLLGIDLLAVSLQVLMLAVLTLLFYLDKRGIALWLCVLFAGSNALFSWMSVRLGPQFYGYGFAVSALLTCAVGLPLLSRKLDRLEFETFMLQR